MIDAQFGGARPWIYHLSNLLYLALVCCLALSLLIKLQVHRLPALPANHETGAAAPPSRLRQGRSIDPNAI